MADLRMALEELLSKWELDQDVDLLREGLEALVKSLMEVEVEEKLRAKRYERTPTRTVTVTAPGAGTPGWEQSSSGSPSCGRGATFPASWNPGGGLRGPCFR